MRIILILSESIACSYVGVIVLSLHVCNRAVDKLSASPFEPAVLYGFDVVSAHVYGSVLAIGIFIVQFVARKVLGTSLAALRIVAIVGPVIVWSVVLCLIYTVTPATGCHP
jgi:hypothetical protein